MNLLAPNGNQTNLTKEQYFLVRTPEFKQWFGDWEKLALTKINDSGIDEISLKRFQITITCYYVYRKSLLKGYLNDINNKCV